MLAGAEPEAESSSRAPVVLVSEARAEEVTVETLYSEAEKYVAAYCQKNGLDPVVENKKWLKKWLARCNQSIKDGSDNGEQSFINRVVVDNKDYFNIEKAKPGQVAEACRIILRYRDANLVWLAALSDAMREEGNLKKTVEFLSLGPK
jgi:hypothetical protein